MSLPILADGEQLRKIVKILRESDAQFFDSSLECSEMIENNYGEPQGTVLGPLLFHLYVNSTIQDNYMYADHGRCLVSDKTPEMFGVLVSGQLVRTEFQLVGENKFLTTITKNGPLNHLVVFLTGAMPFPEGMGGLVYFSLGDPVSPPTWHLLGYISNEKPSAIFKVSGLKNSECKFNADGTPFTFGMSSTVCVEAQIGLAVESLASIQQQCPSLPGGVNNVPPSVTAQICQKMLQSLLNYTMSFAQTQAQMTPNPVETYVPLSVLQTWYTNFERRLLQSPDFLLRD